MFLSTFGVSFNRDPSTGGITDSTKNAYVISNQNTDLRFITYNSAGSVVSGNAMSILNNGNVGINTTGPGTNLDVNGNIQSSIYYDRDNTNYYMDLAANTMPYSLVTAGSVGIGTTAPSQKLDITGGSLRLDNSTGATPTGIVYKGTSPFISDFNYGNNGTITTAGYNTFVGIGAGNLTMGSTATSANQASNNTAIGNNALFSNTTGYQNTANGAYALNDNTTGYYNTANGYSALLFNTTGYGNTANGRYAGIYLSDGVTANATSTNSVFEGYNTMAGAAGDTNEIVIGASAIGNGSNSVTLGNSGIVKTILHGNVGIGTTNPGYKLDVNGTANFTGTTNIAGTNWLQFNGANTILGEGTNTYVQANGAGSIIFRNNTPSELMRIQNNGNVGIGTSTPAGRLDVANGSIVNVGAPVNPNDAATKSYVDSSIATGIALATSTEYWTLSGSNLYPDSTGYRVGIGTTAPGNYGLKVISTTGQAIWGVASSSTANSPLFYLTDNAYAANLESYFDNTTAYLGPYSNSKLSFVRNAGNVSMTIDTSGQVGIGTTTPGTKLDVNGNAESSIYYDRDNTNYYMDLAANTMPYSMNAAGAINVGQGGWFGGAPANSGAILVEGYTGNNYIESFNNARNASQGLVLSGANAGDMGLFSVYATNSYFDGNVGIGTTGPSAKLQINGDYYSPTVVNGNCTGAVTINWSLGNTQHCVLTGNVTFTFTNGNSGGNYRIILKQDATGSRTVTWPATVRWGATGLPTLSTAANATDYVGFIYNGVDSKYDGVAFNSGF